MRPLITALLLIAVALGLGCGGSEQEDEASGPAADVERPPIVAPEPKEKLREAAARLEQAIVGDCSELAKLAPITRQERFGEPQCEQLRSRLKGTTIDSVESFDGLAGVIDLKRGSVISSALMVLDRDGRYHLAWLNSLLREPTVGTEFAEQFDGAAERAVEALGDKDCDAFLKVASRQLGPAGQHRPRELVCSYVDNSPITRLRAEKSNVSPKRIGGNASFAFYTLSADTAHYTMVMTRQSGETLPKRAGTHVYLDAIPTGRPRVTDEGSSAQE